MDTQDYTKSKKAFKTHFPERINQKFKDILEEKGKDKSKVKGQLDWIPGKTKEFLIKLLRKEASTIFKAKKQHML